WPVTRIDRCPEPSRALRAAGNAEAGPPLPVPPCTRFRCRRIREAHTSKLAGGRGRCVVVVTGARTLDRPPTEPASPDSGPADLAAGLLEVPPLRRSGMSILRASGVP